jgi:hypothetical protein
VVAVKAAASGATDSAAPMTDNDRTVSRRTGEEFLDLMSTTARSCSDGRRLRLRRLDKVGQMLSMPKDKKEMAGSLLPDIAREEGQNGRKFTTSRTRSKETVVFEASFCTSDQWSGPLYDLPKSPTFEDFSRILVDEKIPERALAQLIGVLLVAIAEKEKIPSVDRGSFGRSFSATRPVLARRIGICPRQNAAGKCNG